MEENTAKKHIPLPNDTPAFICANCGAVALDQNSICKPQGRGKKADWCGSQSGQSPSFCRNKVNNVRYQCKNCGQVAINSEILCDPQRLAMPD